MKIFQYMIFGSDLLVTCSIKAGLLIMHTLYIEYMSPTLVTLQTW